MDFSDYWVFVRERAYQVEQNPLGDEILERFLTRTRHECVQAHENRKLIFFIIVNARKSLALRIEDMARKAGKETHTPDEKATWGGFINIRLTEEQLAEFDHLTAKNKPTLVDLLTPIAADGKISLGSKDGTFSATMTTTHDGKIYSMSAFSQDLWECLALLVFKVSRYPKWFDIVQEPVKQKRG